MDFSFKIDEYKLSISDSVNESIKYKRPKQIANLFMKNQKKIIASIILILSPLCNSKIVNFTWQDELCEYQGQYHNDQYSEKQIKDTRTLLQMRHGLKLNSTSFAFQPQDIAEIKLDKITQEYKEQQVKLQNFKIVPIKEFQQLKQQVLKELDQEYQHNYLTAAAFTQPEKLLIPNYGAQCFAIAKLLNEKDKRILFQNARNSLEKENKQQLKLGNDPIFLSKQSKAFEAKLKSADAVNYAKIQLIRDWTNCANPHDSETDQLDQVFRKKVFIRSKEIYCDEP